jgi:hypothetical protein
MVKNHEMSSKWSGGTEIDLCHAPEWAQDFKNIV